MTAAQNIDLPTVLAERLSATHPDVLRELLARFIHTLLGAEADTANSTPARALWTLRSPSCARAPTFRTGCWNAANALTGL